MWEVARYRSFERWEAGAEDAGVNFDAAPDCCERVFPGYVGCAGDYVEGLEAEDGYDAGAIYRLVRLVIRELEGQTLNVPSSKGENDH